MLTVTKKGKIFARDGNVTYITKRNSEFIKSKNISELLKESKGKRN